jgi:hypothetical protein
MAATRTVTIRLPENDYKTLKELSERSHSYPATVASRLLSGIMDNVRREWESESVPTEQDGGK